MMTHHSEAAEWSILPSITMRGYYNSNLLLTPLAHDETYGYWVSPGAEFAGKTERLEVSGRTAADFVSYYGGEETQFTNIYLPLSLRYKTETDALGFTGGFTRDNTLMGELLTTGVVLRFTQRDLWSANPTWTRALTEKVSLQASFQFSDASYENGLQLGLVDYQLIGGTAGAQYQVTEKDLVQISGSYTEFHTTNSPTPFRAYFPGANLDLTHTFTETLTANLYGGPRYVNSTTSTGGSDISTRETVWVYGGSLLKNFEQGRIQVKASREIYPSGFGLLIRTDRAGIGGAYRVSETVTALLDASGYIVSGITTPALGGTFRDQRYVNVSPRVAWAFTDWWRLECSYTYGRREVDTFSTAATSHAFALSLTYFPPKFSSSQ